MVQMLSASFHDKDATLTPGKRKKEICAQQEYTQNPVKKSLTEPIECWCLPLGLGTRIATMFAGMSCWPMQLAVRCAAVVMSLSCIVDPKL